MEIKDIGLLVTALAAIVGVATNIIFQRKTYLLLKSKENENEIFKLKIEKYSLLYKEGYELFQFMNDELTQAYEKIKKDKLTADDADEIADKMDAKMDVFQNTFYLNSMFLPKNINDLYEDLLDKLYGEWETDNSVEEDFNMAFKNLKEYEDIFESIIDAKRRDVEIDELHRKLKIRIKA